MFSKVREARTTVQLLGANILAFDSPSHHKSSLVRKLPRAVEPLGRFSACVPDELMMKVSQMYGGPFQPIYPLFPS